VDKPKKRRWTLLDEVNNRFEGEAKLRVTVLFGLQHAGDF
jgi:hypothetical protein